VIRVLVVDDSEAVRTGLVSLLSTTDDVSVVGTCEDGSEVVEAAGTAHPDVVLMDVSMPRVDGIAATTELLAAFPASRVLILSTGISGDAVRRARHAGAVGYLEKAGDATELVAAVRAVAAGASAWSERAKEALRHTG
jgi:DNA-binding NarL/FixJ family response regulator